MLPLLEGEVPDWFLGRFLPYISAWNPGDEAMDLRYNEYPRGANMVALGAYLGATEAVAVDTVVSVIRETFAAKPAVIDVNIEALQKGYALGANAAVEEPAPA